MEKGREEREQMESPDVGSRGHVLATRWGTAWQDHIGIRLLRISGPSMRGLESQDEESDLVFPRKTKEPRKAFEQERSVVSLWQREKNRLWWASRKTRRPGSWLLGTVPEKDSKV